MIKCEAHNKVLNYDSKTQIWMHDDETPCDEMNNLEIMKGYLRKPFTEIDLFDLGDYDYTQFYVEKEVDRALKYILEGTNIEKIRKNLELLEFMALEFIYDASHRYERFLKSTKKFMNDFMSKIIMYYLAKLSNEPFVVPYLKDYSEDINLSKVVNLLNEILYTYGKLHIDDHQHFVGIPRYELILELKNNKLFTKRKKNVFKEAYDLVYIALCYIHKKFPDGNIDLISGFQPPNPYDYYYRLFSDELLKYYKQGLFFSSFEKVSINEIIQDILFQRLKTAVNFEEKIIFLRLYLIIDSYDLKNIFSNISIPRGIKDIFYTMKDVINRSMVQLVGMFNAMAKIMQDYAST